MIGRINVEVLSWIFTESLIRKCFEISMRTVDKKGKEAACDFINEICGVNLDDLNGAANQCECLIGAITV